jgi:Ca2+-binding RTX toxin-like protein
MAASGGNNILSFNIGKGVTFTADINGKVSIVDSGGGNLSYQSGKITGNMLGVGMTYSVINGIGTLTFSSGIFSGTVTFGTTGDSQGKITSLDIKASKLGCTAELKVNAVWPNGGVVLSGSGTLTVPKVPGTHIGGTLWTKPINADLSTVTKFSDFIGFTTASIIPAAAKALEIAIESQTEDPLTVGAVVNTSTFQNANPGIIYSTFNNNVAPPTSAQLASWAQEDAAINGTAAQAEAISYQNAIKNGTVPLGGYQITVDGSGAATAGDSSSGIIEIGGASGNAILNAGAGETVILGGYGNNTINGNSSGTFQYIYGGNSASSGENVPAEIDIINSKNSSGSINYVGTSGGSPQPMTGPDTDVPGAQNGNTTTWTASDNTLYTFVTDGFQPTIGTLTISQGVLGNGQIVINNFNLGQAEDPNNQNGYLGIKLLGSVTTAPGGPSASVPSNPQASVNAIGNDQPVTIYAPVSTSAQTVTLTESGGSGLYYNTGADLLPFSGSVTLTIPAGQDSVTIGLIDAGDPTQSQTVQLTSTLEDDGSTTTPPVSNTLAVSFSATSTPAPTPVTPTDVIAPLYVDPTNSNFTYQGDGGNDIIIGSGSVYNTMYGGSGSDSIVGGPGTNAISAGNGDDTVIGGGMDLVGLGDGNDSVLGGGGNDEITTGNGNSTIAGSGGTVDIDAGNGNNQIYAGSVVSLSAALQSQNSGASNAQGDFFGVGDGSNTIVGGSGNDLILLGTGGDMIVCGDGAVTVIGGVETEYADPFWSTTNTSSAIDLNDVDFNPAPFNAPVGYEGTYLIINGVNVADGTGNDTIFGGTGNSVYYLPNGNNYLDAGGGNDTIQASTGSSTIFGGAGNDGIWGGGGNNYIDGESGNDLIVGEGGNSTIFGGTGDDTIYSGDDGASNWATSQTGTSYLNAGSGNTQLYGAGGSDTLVGGSGNDSLFAGAGNEYLEATTGNTTMTGGAGDDTLVGGSGNDSINAGSGSETITGGSGIDIIFGGADANVISAGDGGTSLSNSTQVTAGSGDATITGGAGIDILVGGSGTDVINAGDGGNATYSTLVNGGSGTDTLTGGGGVYQLTVGSGTDTLVAGSGTGTFIGGAGTATYQINSGSGATNIYDSGAGDTLQFGAGITIANTTVTEVSYSNGNAVTFALNGGGSVTVNEGSLSAATFADGETATFAQLLSPAFTIGDTTYASVSVGLTAVVTSLNSSQNANVSAASTYEGASSANGLSEDGAQTQAPGNGTTATPTQNLTLIGTADLSGSGNNVNDVITANSGNDTLIAGTASDTLVGGGASDMYVVSAATGTVTTINGSSSADTLSFAAGVSLADLSASTELANGALVVTLQNSLGGAVVPTAARRRWAYCWPR